MKTILFPALILFLLASAVSAQNLPKQLHGYVFEIAPEVPKSEVKVIYDGLIRAEDYFAANFRLSLTQAQKRKWKVKIVATGRGNTERGGGGSCCTSASITHKAGPRIFIDVAHKHWMERSRERKLVTIGHEFSHGIQNVMGVLDISGGPMGDWMEEGMAEYYAWEMSVWKRKSRRSQTEKNGFEWAMGDGAIRYSLKQLEPDGGHPHPGSIGQIAVAGLVGISPNGHAAPLVYMQELNRGSRKRAFEIAFGISLNEFYQRFEVWRQAAISGNRVKPVWSR